MKIKFEPKFIVLTVIAFIAAWFLGGKLPYTVFFVLLGVGVYSVWYIKSMFKKIKLVVRTEDDSEYVGEELGAKFFLTNDSSWTSVDTKLITKTGACNEDNQEIEFVITPYSSKGIIKTLEYSYRGAYELGESMLKITDPFGIVSVMKKCDLEKKIDIYPKVYKLLDGTNTRSRYIDSDFIDDKGLENRKFIKDVREYCPGDDIKRIHWKLSAKQNKLMVKNFDRVTGNRAFLFLNMNENNMKDVDKEEEMIECTISIIRELVIKKTKHDLFINDLRQREFLVESEYVYYEIFEYFKNNFSDGKREFNDFMESNINKISRGSWVGIITMRIDRKLLEYIISLSTMGFIVNVIHNEKEKEILEALKEFQIESIDYEDIRRIQIKN